MSSDRQMRRGRGQALYKYLPDSWIDFSVRGNDRKQYIAKVDHWNSEKLVGINTKRLIRVVNDAVQTFARQGVNSNPAVPAITGFGAALSADNCDILTPKASEEERGIVAKISPLTFYCKNCYRIYQFNSEESYRKQSRCKECGTNLAQLRQIYFCKCGYATDKHPVRCREHGSAHIKWDGKYNFYCAVPGCNTRVNMQAICPVCNSRLGPKVALDPSQYFPFSLNLIDLIDEKLEKFIAETEYGKFVVLAYWTGAINRDEFFGIIKNGITTDVDEYNRIFQKNYEMFKPVLGETAARQAAEVAANDVCGNQYHQVIDHIKVLLQTSEENAAKMAEMIFEYDMVKNLSDIVALDGAADVARMLNTNANPQVYKTIAEKYGISNVQACDKIPFISCSYGYTRGESEYKDGVQLHAFKEEKRGRKNIYAIKMDTEGILFEFDRKRILQWLLKNEFISQDDTPDMESHSDMKMWFINHIKQGAIHTFTSINETESPETYYVYRLIHSMSHLLIRAAAEIGGLGKDSLSEYIFPGIPAVLIYCQNSQGFNLGSLSNTFEAYFDRWLNQAFSSAQKCIFDPICIERHKACTGCLFLNEVSCQHFNKDLDRTLVVGHLEKSTKKRVVGYWEEGIKWQ